VKDSVCNESGTEPLQVCTIAILNIPVLTEDILLHFSEGGGEVYEIALLYFSICTLVYLLLLNHLIYFQKNLYELYTVGRLHSMTYFSTMSTNNGKSALQSGSNTNTTVGPEMVKIDIQKICTFYQSYFCRHTITWCKNL